MIIDTRVPEPSDICVPHGNTIVFHAATPEKLRYLLGASFHMAKNVGVLLVHSETTGAMASAIAEQLAYFRLVGEAIEDVFVEPGATIAEDQWSRALAPLLVPSRRSFTTSRQG